MTISKFYNSMRENGVLPASRTRGIIARMYRETKEGQATERNHRTPKERRSLRVREVLANVNGEATEKKRVRRRKQWQKPKTD